MSQKMTFVACGCQIWTSQTTDLIPEKIEKLCNLHKPLERTERVPSIYNTVFAYSRSFVIPAEPFGSSEEDDRIKLEIIQEDLIDSAEKASRAISKPARTVAEMDAEVARRKAGSQLTKPSRPSN